MGYNFSGFAFTSEPSWKDIAKNLPESICLRGYKHLSSNIWLLDVWHSSPRIHTPFEEVFTEELKNFLPQATNDLIKTFEDICTTIDKDAFIFESECFRLTSQLSQIGKNESFFFAGDDNELDVACSASNGKLKSFRIRYPDFAIEYLGNTITFIPFDIINNPKLNLEPELIMLISKMSNVTIGSPEKVDVGIPLYESIRRLWPSGDAFEILGLRDGEPFENLESDYYVINERIQLKKIFNSINIENQPKSEKPINKDRAAWFAGWGIKLFGVCIVLLSIGGAISKIFFSEYAGKGISTELYFILVPIWGIGILGLVFIQIGWCFWPNRYKTLGNEILEGKQGISPSIQNLLKPFSIFFSFGVLMALISSLTSEDLAKDFPGYSGHVMFYFFSVYAIGIHFLTFNYEQKKHTIITTYLRYFFPPFAFLILPINLPLIIILHLIRKI